MNSQLNELKRHKIKEFVKEWCSSSTSHGIPNIARTDKISVKFIWLIFVLAATGLCSFMVARSVMDFIGFDVVTKIRDYREVPAEFPTITVCNINPLTSKFADNLLNQSFRDWAYLYSKDLNFSLLDYHINGFQYETKHPSFDMEDRRKLGPDSAQMIIDYNFAGKKNMTVATIDEKSYLTEFEWLYTINYGGCYRFNSGKNVLNNEMPIKRVRKEGRYSELELELFITDTNSVTDLNSNRGFRVFIENSSYAPSTFEGGIAIKSNTLTEISIKKVITERLPMPFSSCQTSYPLEGFYDRFREKNMPYKQRDCFNLCIQDKIVSQCECYSLIYDYAYDDFSPCEYYSECLVNACQHYSNESIDPLTTSCINDQFNDFCSNLCQQECTEIKYELSLSYSDFPSNKKIDSYYRQKKRINDNFNLEGITEYDRSNELYKSKLAKLKIYFNDLSYRKISESEKMKFIDLVASIGGTMGLFLGISILSFFELVELILNIIYICFHKSKSKHAISPGSLINVKEP